jgi:hypothetical protein
LSGGGLFVCAWTGFGARVTKDRGKASGFGHTFWSPLPVVLPAWRSRRAWSFVTPREAVTRAGLSNGSCDAPRRLRQCLGAFCFEVGAHNLVSSFGVWVSVRPEGSALRRLIRPGQAARGAFPPPTARSARGRGSTGCAAPSCRPGHSCRPGQRSGHSARRLDAPVALRRLTLLTAAAARRRYVREQAGSLPG